MMTENLQEVSPSSSNDSDERSISDKGSGQVSDKKFSPEEIKKPRKRARRTYPVSSFSDALEMGKAIYQHAGTDKIRRLTLLTKMDRSPTSGATRMMMTNSNKYGITKGGYQAEYIELTPEGKVIFDTSTSPRDRLQAKFNLAISKIPPFKKLYDKYVSNRLPAPEVMRDFLKDSDEDISDYKECTDFFVVNVESLNLLRTIAGAQTLIPIEHLLEETSKTTDETGNLSDSSIVIDPSNTAESAFSEIKDESSISSLDDVCFYITPIGDEDSEQRKHSDLFLGSLVEPAVAELNLRVIRADQIGQQGLITAQVMEHVRCSRLVIVDLSFLNPNVFYEMALRHACRRPIVHIIRKADKIPFDVSQSRCIVIDDTDIYSFVPKIQTYKAEIATHARRALEDPEHNGNPITIFYPEFWSDSNENH